jgi:hypothetical protein
VANALSASVKIITNLKNKQLIKNVLSCGMYMALMMLGRHTTKILVPEFSSFKTEIAIEKVENI